jgi:CubicO group peptidase (beta-lactamase class C family)
MTLSEHLPPYLQSLEIQDAFSGAVMIKQGDAEVFAGAYGYANRAWGVRNTLDMRFDTASITKLFTAVSILQLVERRLITLDTHVVDYLGLHNTAISPDVQVYHLLTHTSGIADDADEEAGESYENVWRDKPNYRVTNTADFLLNFVHKLPNFAPGEGCRYCNCSYVLLGLMIEKAADQPYRDYVQENIFNRAGMRNSGFFHMAHAEPNVAEGHDPMFDENKNIVGWKRNIYSYPPIGSPDGGAHATAGDLVSFLGAVQRSELLSPEGTRELLTPRVLYRQGERGNLKFGYGLLFRFDKSGELVFYQKEGENPGVSGLLRYYPAQDTTVVVLSNTMEGAWEPVRKINELILDS